ncbi:hypothetical protein ACJIZ3_001208 [Penstemon smallii]|uniref:DNA polymerase V n=1 Tax=Penstemon smallii TaxID=265156 RepID=A0ABD3U5S7_9LAMI
MEELAEDKQVITGTENVTAEPSKKKMKKKKDIEMVDIQNQNDAKTTNGNCWIRKKYQTETLPKIKNLELKNENTSTSNNSGGVLPEFHIGVFKNLAATDASIREAAARSLVTELRKFRMPMITPSYRYAIRRLIRGVSSSRECARQGFALGLTILVATVPSIKLESLLKLIITLLEVSSSMKGQVEFTSCVIALAAKKGTYKSLLSQLYWKWLRRYSISTVEALPSHVLEAPGLQEWFEGATEVGNPDALLLALKIREKVGLDNKFGKLLPSPYNKNKFFSADHLSKIASCLKESTFRQPRVHCLWPFLVSNLLSDGAKDVDSALGLNSVKKHKRSRNCSSAEEDIDRHLWCFCEVIIEGSFSPSSHDRKNLAYDILLLLLPKLPASSVQVVLSFKVVQCLMDIFSTKDSWLYKVAQHFLKELSEWVMHDDFRRQWEFDCISRSKTVKDLMTEFKTESGCVLLIQNMITMFLDECHSSDESSDQSQTTDDNSEIGSLEDKDVVETSEFLKSWVVESLPTVSNHLKLDQDAKFRVQKVLKFLAVQGLFSSSLGTEVTSFELQEKIRWPKSSIPGAMCQMCIEQLQLLLANVQKGEGPHAESSGVEAIDLGSYFSVMDANKMHAMRYLLIQLLLQILLRPREFFEAASKLVMCCKKAFGSSDLVDPSEEDEPDEDGAPELMDVFDGLLRMLRVIKKDFKPVKHQFTDSEGDDTDDNILGVEEADESDEPETGETVDSDEQTDDSEAAVGVEALANMVRERNSKAGLETTLSQLVLFKLRVLSLLEIYLHENPGSDQLGQRIWGIIQKKIFKAKDYPKAEELQLDILETFLEKYPKLAEKAFKKKQSASSPSKKKQSASWNRHKMITSLAQSSAFWILKVIDARNFSDSELQRVCEIFKNVLFRQVEALDLVTELLRPLLSSNANANESGSDASKMLKSQLPKLCHLIKHLVANMPEKQSRRAEVRKFCGKVFQILTTFKLTSIFLKALEPGGHTACESQLGDIFLVLKK